MQVAADVVAFAQKTIKRHRGLDFASRKSKKAMVAEIDEIYPYSWSLHRRCGLSYLTIRPSAKLAQHNTARRSLVSEDLLTYNLSQSLKHASCDYGNGEEGYNSHQDHDYKE
jgi:hypothetical protein